MLAALVLTKPPTPGDEDDPFDLGGAISLSVGETLTGSGTLGFISACKASEKGLRRAGVEDAGEGRASEAVLERVGTAYEEDIIAGTERDLIMFGFGVAEGAALESVVDEAADRERGGALSMFGFVAIEGAAWETVVDAAARGGGGGAFPFLKAA